MESATKNTQTKEDILKMVQKAFGSYYTSEDITVKELTEGFFNVAYEVGLPNQNIILKIAPPAYTLIMSYEKDIMRAEVEALRSVKESTSVPVPKVLYYDDSHSLCGADYFFMEKLEGESFYKLKSTGQLSWEEQQQLLRNLGRYNAEMNQIRGTTFGYLGQDHKLGLSWKETFTSMILDVLKDGDWIDISLGVEYNEVLELIMNASFALDEVKEPVFVHWDLWDGNVFVKDGRITGLIDFERALWGDPLMECYFRAHCYNGDFIQGYGEDLRQKAPIRALLYDMYLYLIMIIETKFRKYPDDWQYQFASKELKKAMEELRKLL
jgi:aminoglycoside phosphotransferase (APT) family kinase protein